ncbi:se21 [Alphabaculovirus alterspexiguae]|uniref:Se21 n=1 Tax=Spodoptera exigua multiple nucleopolyhedrovirus TaxID=10454 RepID=A0A3G2JTS3_9ABAC|nr:se21 [Spodoptera exigua multiple nucleopolyhedrovirus]AYN44981.1 se21 [Spodoptera exigua multiple nucleopolyhedrovirus]
MQCALSIVFLLFSFASSDVIDICVENKCNGERIIDKFARQQFDFENVTHLQDFAKWVELSSNVQRYNPQNRTIGVVGKFLNNFVLLAGKQAHLSVNLQTAGDVVFKVVTELYVNYHDMQKHWNLYQNFFNTFIIWAPLKFKTLLAMYAEIRSSMVSSRYRVSQTDDACINLISLALGYPMSVMSMRDVRQEVYIYYVSKIKNRLDWDRFKGMYEAIEPLQFPHTTLMRSGPLNISVHHNVHDLRVLVKMQQECEYVYENFKKLWQRLNVTFTHTIFNVDVYVYKNRHEYTRTGLLFATSVNNGGVSIYNYNEKKIHASVYFEDENDIPSAFGHELFHCLLYSSNRRVVHLPNSNWYLEGAANRFGYRKCYWFDYFNLRNYEHKTVAEIVGSTYGDKILYPMGSALVSFLYEKRPDILRRAVLTHNYTIVSDDVIENDFTNFKRNKLIECKYYNNNNNNRRNEKMFNIQKQYFQMLPKDIFKDCRNYITLQFEDCVFVLTPSNLYMKNKVRNVNPQKIIRSNRNEVTTQFDFDFMQKGIIKLGAKLMLKNIKDPFNVIDKFFSIDDNYSYACNVSCAGETIIRLMLSVPLLTSTLFVNTTSVEAAKNIVRRYEEIANGCQLYIPPPVGVEGRLRMYVNNLFNLRNEHVAESNLRKPVDAHRNTIIHLAAMFNRPLFLRFYRQNNRLTKTLLNYYNATPTWLFENTQKYVHFFGHEPSRYCITIVSGNYSYVYPPLLKHSNDVIINNTLNFTTAIFIIIIITILVVGICLSTLITYFIVKHYYNKLKNINYTFNKQKFYTNNECTTFLFE